MTSPAILVEGLVKKYGNNVAVNKLDLKINPGEIFALLGPNGAGKSTTIEILEGYRKRNAGKVQVLGEDPQRISGKAERVWREKIGIMLQSTSVMNLLTPAEALSHHASFYPNPRGVEETLAAVGLTEKAGALTRTLSGGQRRRLDVALAVIGNPELVFLDEPTTGFDPQARRQFWELIAGLRDTGATVILTTHYLDEAEHLADRLGIIAQGQLVALDTPAGLRAKAQMATVKWRENGAIQQVETTAPTALLRDLLAKFSGEVPDLEVHWPSLEEVYLDLINTEEENDD